MPDALQFKIQGMDCAEEVNILKRELRDLAGSESNLSFDILNGRMTLRDAGQLSAQQVIDRVARTGMTAKLWADAGQTGARSETRTWWRDARTAMTALSGSLIAVGFCVHLLLSGSWLAAFAPEDAGVDAVIPIAVRVLYFFAVITGA